jgi:alpha-L-rhamnosidase
MDKRSTYIKFNKRYVFVTLLSLMFFADVAEAQKATWIWYPGDYEVWLSNKMQNRRTERGAFFPPFWKLDSHYVLVDFHKDFVLTQPETVELAAEGQYNVKLDGKALSGYPKSISVPAGRHKLSLKIYNQAAAPAIYVKGQHLVSDTSWLVTYEDKEWIDESGKTSDVSATKYVNAGAWNFDSADRIPSAFKLHTEEHRAAKTEKKEHAILVDFGKETFGYAKLIGLKGKGNIKLCYGESKEEALATTTCELLDSIYIDQPQKMISRCKAHEDFGILMYCLMTM